MSADLTAVAEVIRHRVSIIHETDDALEWLHGGRQYTITRKVDGWLVTSATVGWRARENGVQRVIADAPTPEAALATARAMSRA
jgi:hypothetical protein